MKLALLTLLLAAAASVHARTLQFEVLLDDQPVGEHRFELTPDGDGLRLRSEARMTVRVLGIPLYRYRHTADERWSGGCLRSLEATTDDNGKVTQVSRPHPGPLPQAGEGANAKECLMTFAYWNPAILRQSRLLNPQTGEVEAVRIERIGDGDQPVRWRIHTRTNPVDLLLSASGEWIGLDSTLAGGKRLAYRLKP